MLAAFESQCEKEDASLAQRNKLAPAQMVEFKKLKQNADCETITYRQELETLRRQRNTANEGLRQVNVAMRNCEATVKEMRETVSRNLERIGENKSKISELSEVDKEMELKLEETRATLHQSHTLRQQRDEELARIANQLNELRFFKEDNKHNDKIAEALQALKSMHSGVQGRLVDLCSIPDPRYTNAVTVGVRQEPGSHCCRHHRHCAGLCALLEGAAHWVHDIHSSIFSTRQGRQRSSSHFRRHMSPCGRLREVRCGSATSDSVCTGARRLCATPWRRRAELRINMPAVSVSR